MAGVTHEDVDALMCYDNFSPTVLFSLEGLDFARAASRVRSSRTARSAWAAGCR